MLDLWSGDRASASPFTASMSEEAVIPSQWQTRSSNGILSIDRPPFVLEQLVCCQIYVLCSFVSQEVLRASPLANSLDCRYVS